MNIVPLLRLKGRALLKPSYAKGELSALGSKLSDKYGRVYVIDIEGVERNKPQLDAVQELCDEIPTLYEGGVRYGVNIIDMLVTGAEKAVIGTATLTSTEELRVAFKLSDNIILKVDFRDGIVSFDPSIAGRDFLALAREVKDIGVAEIIVPPSLAREAARHKRELGFTLGVIAPTTERSLYEPLGVDYLVSEDVGGLDGDE